MVVIEDPLVLLFLLVAWISLLVSWLAQKNGRFQITEAGRMVQVKSEKQLQKQLDKVGRSRFLYRPDGKLRVRTFAAFCDGSDPPPPPSVSFQEPYTSQKRRYVYRTVLRGALTRCWRFIVICGLIAVSLSWWTRSCEAFSQELGTAFISYEAVFGNLKAAAAIHTVMLPLASFVLALYINQKVAWFNSIIDEAWLIQGKMADLTLILSSTMVGPDLVDMEVKAAKYRIYRYLNLAHLSLYKAFNDEFTTLTLDDLQQIGLVTPEEQRALTRSVTPRSTALLWTGMTCQELADNGKMSPQCMSRVLEVVREIRGKMDTLAKELTRVTPISFVQLLQLMVDILLFLTPAAFNYELETKRDGMTVYLWPAIGSMILSLFYQGGMKFICSLECPFGSDLDDLRSEWLLQATDRAMYGYLTDLPPPPLSVEVQRVSCFVNSGKVTSDEEVGAAYPSATTTPVPSVGGTATADSGFQNILPGAPCSTSQRTVASAAQW